MVQLSPAVEMKSSSPALQTRPLSPALGAEIIGVDLRQEMDERVTAQVLEIWHENLVILLRDQHLSEEDEVRFAERFGPPAVIHTKQFIQKHPAVMLISNIREDGKPIGALPDGEMHFHSDQCYQERPAMASMLYAIEVPSKGGNTLFANAYAAYETLPEDDQAAHRGPPRAQCLRLRHRRHQARHQGRRWRADLRAPGGANASGDRPQGALCQPPDDRADRGHAGGKRATSFSTFCSITRSSANSFTSTSGAWATS